MAETSSAATSLLKSCPLFLFCFYRGLCPGTIVNDVICRSIMGISIGDSKVGKPNLL